MISCGTPKAKAGHWDLPDSETRKRGEQKGLLILFSYKTCASAQVNDIRFAQIFRQKFGTRRYGSDQIFVTGKFAAALIHLLTAPFATSFITKTKSHLGKWEIVPSDYRRMKTWLYRGNPSDFLKEATPREVSCIAGWESFFVIRQLRARMAAGV